MRKLHTTWSRTVIKLVLILLLLVIAAVSAMPQPVQAKGRSQVTGTVVADLGFRPIPDGFGFANYGAIPPDVKVSNLVPADIQRLFGDSICASKKDGVCVLTPTGQQFMDLINNAMNGGHCEGFAALSLLLYTKQLNVTDFGSDKTVTLKLLENDKLQREIALWFTTQITDPTDSNKVKDRTPAEILDMLIEAYKDPKNIKETYTIALFQPGFKGGHAVTPYAVVDQGSGKYLIALYDNNFPGEERYMEIDRTANTWKYIAATNPDEPEAVYEGNAETKTLRLTPTKPREGQQTCTICAQLGSSKVFGRAAEAPQYNDVWLEGNADLLITDEEGHQLGYVDGNFVNTFPDSQFTPLTSENLYVDDPEPVYSIPRGKAFEIALSGKEVKTETPSSVTLLGDGYDLSVENVKLEPGQVDSIVFTPDGKALNYKPGGNEAPDMTLGTSTTGADYSFTLKGIEVDQGGSVNAALAMDKGQLAISIADSKEAAAFGIEFSRYDDDGEVTFTGDDVSLNSGDIMYIDFAGWTGQGGTLKVEVDEKGDGTIDQTLELKDNQ